MGSEINYNLQCGGARWLGAVCGAFAVWKKVARSSAVSKFWTAHETRLYSVKDVLELSGAHSVEITTQEYSGLESERKEQCSAIRGVPDNLNRFCLAFISPNLTQ